MNYTNRDHPDNFRPFPSSTTTNSSSSTTLPPTFNSSNSRHLNNMSHSYSSSPSPFCFLSSLTDEQFQKELFRRSIELYRHPRHACKFCNRNLHLIKMLNEQVREQKLQLVEKDRQIKNLEKNRTHIDIGTQKLQHDITSSSFTSLPPLTASSQPAQRPTSPLRFHRNMRWLRHRAKSPSRSHRNMRWLRHRAKARRHPEKDNFKRARQSYEDLLKTATKRKMKTKAKAKMTAKNTLCRPRTTRNTIGLPSPSLPSPPPLSRSQTDSVSITIPKTLTCLQCSDPVLSYVPSLGHHNYRCTRCMLEDPARSTDDSEGSEEDLDIHLKSYDDYLYDEICTPFFPFDDPNEEEG